MTRAHSVRRGRGFTLLEMLVVVSVVVLLALVAIPAFSGMIASSQRAQAEEALKRAMAMGHGLALRSSLGRDIAMVFMYEPPGPMQIVACARIAEFDDADPADTSGRSRVRREVFVPMGAADPIALPPYWTVRGYALPTMIDQEWYDAGASGQERYAFGEASWVFPESGFYDVNLGDAANDGKNRQTFMVRFDGGTGRMSMSNLRAAVVISPRPSAAGRVPGPAGLPSADVAQDLDRWVQRVLTAQDFDGDGQINAADQLAKLRLIGDESADTILVRPVGQLALCNERALAAGLGAAVDVKTRCLYAYTAPADPANAQRSRPAYPKFVRGVSDKRINAWIEGDTNINGVFPPFDPNDKPEAKVYFIDRFSGEARPLALQPASVGIN